MTTSLLPSRYRINGLLDTNRPVFENMGMIANAAASFVTYDIHTGLWSVVINRTGSSVASFDDSNIIGAINVNGTGLNQLYNSVRVEFPLRDTADGVDYVVIEIPEEDRYPNEPDNQLQITLPMCNEPVQAEIIGLIELKQSRVDEIITFVTDYSVINLNAGDIISVTNAQYQFTNREYRVITLSEIDTDDGGIVIEVTALRYVAAVYDDSDLSRYIRTDRNGIRTIGAIGTPSTPVINPYQLNSRPRIVVECTVPTGIVESMELWVSTDNVNFRLQQEQFNPGGGNFAAGAAVTFDYDQVSTSNYYVKVRAMNSTTTGPFSAVASYVAFTPVQAPDAVPQDAPLVDSSGNLLLGLLLSKIAGWALSRSPDWSSPGGVLSQLGLTVNDFTTATGAPANVSIGVTVDTATAAFTQSRYNLRAGSATLAGFQGTSPLNPALTFNFNVAYNGSILQFVCESPYGGMDFEYIDRTGAVRTHTQNLMYFPTLITARRNGVEILNTTVDWQTQSTTLNITPAQAGGDLTGTWQISYVLIPTYDLDMTNTFDGNSPRIYCYNLTAARDTRVLAQIFA